MGWYAINLNTKWLMNRKLNTVPVVTSFLNMDLPLFKKPALHVLLILATALMLMAVQQVKAAAVTEAWVHRYNGPSNRNDEPAAVAVDAHGDVVVTGYSEDLINSLGESIGNCYTAKYAAADGALLWEKRYYGLANSGAEGSAVAVDGGGNVIVTGASYNGSRTNSDYYTAKYSAKDGSLLWEKTYNGPANREDYALAVAVDGSGDVVVTGESRYSTIVNDYGYYTAKYAAADGALLWERRHDENVNSRPTAMALDSSGNVMVTGMTTGLSSTDADFYTVKYAAADGALIWEKRYNGPADLFDYPVALAVDSSGNVVVTGLSWRNSTAYSDYYTAKYAAADGTLLWEKRYNGPTNGSPYPYNEATAVAVDASGNVVVTGYSGEHNFDCYTVKYAATDGALLWEKRYNGPDNQNDQGQAVVMDASGNVVVAGSVGVPFHAFYQENFYTAKYAAADGALLWEKSYNGPANGSDSAYSLAITPYGMVVVTGISDGAAAPYFSRRDYLTIAYAEPLPPISIALIPAGVRLRSTGIPGLSYRLQRSPGVNGPWSTLVVPAAPADGLIEYIDTTPPPGAAFYRMSVP